MSGAGECPPGAHDVASRIEQPAAIDIRDARFRYAGAAEPVLAGLSWSVPAGAFALLVGGTGSGKTTLLSQLKPEIAPAGERCGQVMVHGRPIADFGPAESAASIGYVFQNPDNQIVCDTVWHEMAFGLESLGAPQDEMRRLIAETCCFFGMEGWFRQRTATLSGGRKQLLALASTLVMQPRLLLLDEPTAQLDPVQAKNFLHALFRVNRELDITIVVATHEPRFMVDYATCAFRIDRGVVAEVPDLRSLCGRLRLLESRRLRPPSGDEALAVRRGWFRYERDGGWVLRNLDLVIRTGRVHALIGGNGAGKSTLLAIMARVARLGRGSLFRAADRVALLPQSPRALLVCESVQQELDEWSGVAGYGAAEVDAMLRRLGLGSLARRHPLDLSSGQQQLLALGKLLLVGPELLLLDEPTKGLDAAARRMVARTLDDLRQTGATVVVATHDLDFVEQVADDVSMVFDGEIAATEPGEEFFRHNVYYLP